MRTLGVDLAAQPENTAACAIDWAGDRALVSPPELDLADDDLLHQIGEADKVGVDAPFGWPDEFAEALASTRGWTASQILTGASCAIERPIASSSIVPVDP